MVGAGLLRWLDVHAMTGVDLWQNFNLTVTCTQIGRTASARFHMWHPMTSLRRLIPLTLLSSSIYMFPFPLQGSLY